MNSFKIKKSHNSSIHLFIAVVGTIFALMSIAQGTAESINQYLEEIDLVEANEGSYSSQLSDLLMSLGNSYQANSDFENANLVYQRGMQIEKINYGLFSLSQTPYLKAIAESHRAMNDWEQSQKAIDQYYLVNEKVYGQRDVRMLPVIESLINWHTESYNMRDPRDSFPNLTSLEILARKLHVILDESADLGDPSTPKKYKQIGRIQYMLARHIKDYGLPQEGGMSITTDRYATERNSPISSHNYYSRGSAALQKVVKATMEQSPSVMMDQIEAVANLGDWYLIFGQVGSATKAYSLADELISVSSEPELIRNNIFGMGKIINFDEPSKDGFLNDDRDFNLIEVSMTISRSGSALDIEIDKEKNDLTDDDERVLRKYFKKRRFRPSFSDGKTRSMQLILPYYLPKVEA